MKSVFAFLLTFMSGVPLAEVIIDHLPMKTSSAYKQFIAATKKTER